MWPAATVATVDGVLQHFAVPQACWDAFCQSVGDPGNDIRVVASLPPQLVADALLACRLPSGRRVTAVEATQVGMVFRACHRAVFLMAGGEPVGWTDPDPWALTTSGTSSTAGLPGGGGIGPTPIASPERKMKLSQVADQGDESEFIVEAGANKGKYYAFYLQKVVLRKTEVLRQPPYVDFSVFVPFAKRYLKAQKYQSFILQEDGSFLAKMVPGPACFDHWQACYRVLRTTLVMTDTISLANLMEWESWVEKLNRRYPDCWGLVVAAEDRARGEYMAKTLVRLKLDIDRGERAPPGWDPLRPWDTVWNKVLKDAEYWNENVVVPAITWAARGSKGRPLNPIEEAAEAGLRGGYKSLRPEMNRKEKEENDSPNSRTRTRREARKRKRREDKEELSHLRKGKGGGKGGGPSSGGKGGSTGEALCFAWNNGNGLCGGLAPGEQCKGKVQRAHNALCASHPGTHRRIAHARNKLGRLVGLPNYVWGIPRRRKRFQ